MGSDYALQVAMAAAILSALALSGMFVASRLYDRNLRRYDGAVRPRKAE